MSGSTGPGLNPGSIEASLASGFTEVDVVPETAFSGLDPGASLEIGAAGACLTLEW